MIDNILDKLNTEIRDPLNIKAQCLQGGRLVAFCFAGKEEIVQCFAALVDRIKKSGAIIPSDLVVTSQAEDDGALSSFLAVVRRHKIRGCSIKTMVDSVKAVRTVIESLIEKSVAADSDKLRVLRLLWQQSDLIEHSIFTEWSKSQEDQLIATLQADNLRLAQEKQTYANIFEETTNLVLITDSQGRVIKANPRAVIFFSDRDLLGCFCGELLGLPESVGSLDEVLWVYPSDRPHEFSLKSGDYRSVFNLQIKPLSTPDVLVSPGVMLLLSDITCMVDHRQALERSIAERTRALANSEKTLNAIFQSVGKGILVVDRDHEIVKANQKASEIYGIPLEILTGTALDRLTDKSGYEDLVTIKNQLVEELQDQIEIVSHYVDGRPFPSLVTMSLMSLDGQPYWILIVSDISEEKALSLKLQEEKRHAEEMNVTLRHVLKTIEADRKEVEQKFTDRIKNSILPSLKKIKESPEEDGRYSYLGLLEGELLALTGDFQNELDGDMLKLTRTELKVCQYLKAGLSGKAVSEAMNLSFETIQTHRKNIRKKLGLRGREQSLYHYLVSRNFDF